MKAAENGYLLQDSAGLIRRVHGAKAYAHLAASTILSLHESHAGVQGLDESVAAAAAPELLEAGVALG